MTAGRIAGTVYAFYLDTATDFLMVSRSKIVRLALAIAAGALAACSTPQQSGGTTYYNAQPTYTQPYRAPNRLPSTPPPAIHAEAYVLIDADTGQTLASKSPDRTMPVASTQKLLTALIVCESGNLDGSLRIQASDARVEPTKFGLRAGQVFTRRELLGGLLVKSCNDIAVALARDNAGSSQAFASRMTARARSLGATRTMFANPHGLTAANNFSTARDMSKIARAAYFNPTIRSFTNKRYVSMGGKTLKNTNDLLGKMPECNGMKTGYTLAAGRCLVSSASGGGRNVILVQLGTKTRYIWDDGRALMSWALRG